MADPTIARVIATAPVRPAVPVVILPPPMMTTTTAVVRREAIVRVVAKTTGDAVPLVTSMNVRGMAARPRVTATVHLVRVTQRIRTTLVAPLHAAMMIPMRMATPVLMTRAHVLPLGAPEAL